MRNLIIAAHPDDEILGCGGTIALLLAQKDEVRVVIMGEGITSRGTESPEAELRALRIASKRANAQLGVTDLHFEKLPDNRFDSLSILDITQKIELHIAQFTPDRIFTHSASDLNIDHRLLHQAVITASRPQPGTKVNELYFFEVRSSTEWNFSDSNPGFQPKLYWNISSTIEQKKLALTEYSSEMREWPHSRSIKAVEFLAHHRGAEVGVAAAEAFSIGRILR